MLYLPARIDRCFRRSSYHRRGMIVVAALGTATKSQISRLARIPPDRVDMTFVGDRRYFQPAISPVELGLARAAVGARGEPCYEITPFGAALMRAIVAEWPEWSAETALAGGGRSWDDIVTDVRRSEAAKASAGVELRT